ncbi:MAG: serine hydrolase domain-containing protein [Planctomycetota bacterium]|jgi:CubicO group peptidase (beta-lactamase class C family)|nr:serine hydrolase domain-containing protein [Planctomycetota bacterium]
MPHPSDTVLGEVASGFEPVRDVFAWNLRRGGELGASLCVERDGVRLVDIWGGWIDPERTRPWEVGTRSILFSATKGLAATAFFILSQREGLDHDRPIQDFWPEFRGGGKESITIAHLLSHRTGFCSIDTPLSLEDLKNREVICRALERQECIWKPGTVQAYGAVTLGLILPELFLRVTGETVGRFFLSEVALPLGSDARLGLPIEEQGDVSPVQPFGGFWDWLDILGHVLRPGTNDGRFFRGFLRPGSPSRKALGNPRELGKGYLENFNRPEVRAMEIAWAGGVASARGMARFYSVLASGGSGQGVRLVDPEAIEKLYPRDSWEIDEVLRKSIGYTHGFVKEDELLFSPNTESFGHPGAGGTLGWADPVNRLGIGYVMNRMDHHLRSPRAIRLCHSIYSCLKKISI